MSDPTTYTVTAAHAVDTDTGRMVGPGEQFTSSVESERLTDLLAARSIAVVPATPKKKESS